MLQALPAQLTRPMRKIPVLSPRSQSSTASSPHRELFTAWMPGSSAAEGQRPNPGYRQGRAQQRWRQAHGEWGNAHPEVEPAESCWNDSKRKTTKWEEKEGQKYFQIGPTKK